MKKIYLLYTFIFIIIISSCKNNNSVINKNIVSEDTIKMILTDIYLIESKAYKIKNQDSANRTTKASYLFVFDKYGIDSLKFKASMNYYLTDPIIADKLYEEMIDSLQKLQSIIISKDTTAKRGTSTINTEQIPFSKSNN